MCALCSSFRTGILLCLLFCSTSLIGWGQINKLVIVDPLVSGKSSEIINNNPTAKVLILPDNENPLRLITAEIKKASFDEIHLYLLTKPGSVIFDEINIIPENVQDYSADLSEWKKYLKSEAVIYIHSENLTSIPEGINIVNSISSFTGKKVLVEK
ncbi:MAG TPA: DUF4347 domain-containing protein [Bacteroidales bacterium]|jgi:hypothetical protein|nr:DUF4347 domain-containing protein [Bacteroidales bacterium]